jgi:hypothetical protein
MSFSALRLTSGLVVLAVAIAGCGSSSKTSSTASTTTTASKAPATNAKVAALVPAAVKSSGTLSVAADDLRGEPSEAAVTEVEARLEVIAKRLSRLGQAT